MSFFPRSNQHPGFSPNLLEIQSAQYVSSDPSKDATKDVLEQAKIIFQVVRKKAMQAYIKYKAYYDKKANTSILRRITSTCYKPKQITKAVKFCYQTSVGLG